MDQSQVFRPVSTAITRLLVKAFISDHPVALIFYMWLSGRVVRIHRFHPTHPFCLCLHCWSTELLPSRLWHLYFWGTTDWCHYLEEQTPPEHWMQGECVNVLVGDSFWKFTLSKNKKTRKPHYFSALSLVI